MTARACLEAGIEAAHPATVVPATVSVSAGTLRVGEAAYRVDEYDDVVVVGAGKAAGPVVAELEVLLGDRLSDGVVVTTTETATESVEVLVGSHPLPDRAAVDRSDRVLELTRAADESTLVLAVFTGGGSALLTRPGEGIAVSDLRALTEDLLASGATIREVNAVRKHSSSLKGGGLARAAAPATVVGLLISDVVGNDVSAIASGPTAPDPTTYGDAVDVLERYGIEPPAAVNERLVRGRSGELPETPTATHPAFDRVNNHVLADGWTALAAARSVAADRGYAPVVLTSRLRGAASEVARVLVAVAGEVRATGEPIDPPAALLWGGETTVTVRGSGTGGPNLELCLAAALELSAGTTVGSLDTDGLDGSSAVAGAIVDATTVTDVAAARAALRSNDAAGFLAGRGVFVETGSTGTNVNDLGVALVER